MSDKNEPVFENEEFLLLLQKYERMRTGDNASFFDVEEFEQIIDYYLDEFQYDQANEAAELGAQQHPGSVEIKYKVVHIYLEQGIGKKAIEMLELIPDWEHTNPEYHYLYGTAQCLTGRNHDAEKSFDHGLELASEDTFEALLNIAIAFENARHYQLAIKYLKQAYEINPDFLSVLYDLGYFHERIDKFEKSVEYYEKYLDIDPFSENVWYNLGVVYFKLKKPAQAIEAYDYSLALNPDYASAYFNKANTYASINNYGKAVDAMKEFLELEPDNTQALSFMGECYEQMYKYNDALAAYKKIIEIDNTDTEGWFGAGMILYQVNKFSEASIYLLKALEFDPKNTDFWINLGYIYEAEGKAQEAIKCYRQVTLIDKNDYEAWMSLVSLLIRMKEFELSLVYLREAFIQFPQDDRLTIKLAECHFRRGKEILGLKYLHMALQSNPTVLEEFTRSYKKALWSKNIQEAVKKYLNSRS